MLRLVSYSTYRRTGTEVLTKPSQTEHDSQPLLVQTYGLNSLHLIPLLPSLFLPRISPSTSLTILEYGLNCQSITSCCKRGSILSSTNPQIRSTNQNIPIVIKHLSCLQTILTNVTVQDLFLQVQDDAMPQSISPTFLLHPSLTCQKQKP